MQFVPIVITSASTDNSVNEDDVKTEPVKDDSQNNGDYSEAETSSVELVVSAESIEEEPRLDGTPTQDTLTIDLHLVMPKYLPMM